MNKDEIYEIMLNAHLNELKELCLTNQYSFNLCQNKRFWKNKYHHFNYPMIEYLKQFDWRARFIEMYKTDMTLKKVFNLLTNTLCVDIDLEITIHTKAFGIHLSDLLKYIPENYLTNIDLTLPHDQIRFNVTNKSIRVSKPEEDDDIVYMLASYAEIYDILLKTLCEYYTGSSIMVELYV